MQTVRFATRNRFPGYARANLRWCVDGTGKAHALGVEHFILGIIDYGTRMNLLLITLAQANAGTILAHIVLAIYDAWSSSRSTRLNVATVSGFCFSFAPEIASRNTELMSV